MHEGKEPITLIIRIRANYTNDDYSDNNAIGMLLDPSRMPAIICLIRSANHSGEGALFSFWFNTPTLGSVQLLGYALAFLIPRELAPR